MSDVKTKKPMPTIGVDRYTFFPVTEDAADATTYGAAVGLPGTVEIAPTDNGATEAFDADNGTYLNDSYLEQLGHDITNADIPPAVDAAWRGLELKNGMVEVGDVVQAPYFGVAWRVLKADGSYRYVRYYKGTYAFASSIGGKTKPSKGASEKQTAKASFSAVKRLSDGMYYAYLDDDALPEGVTKETLEEKWFSDMSWVPGTVPEA